MSGIGSFFFGGGGGGGGCWAGWAGLKIENSPIALWKK